MTNQNTNCIQPESNTAHDEDQERVLHVRNIYESLDGLQEDGHGQS